MLGKCDIVKISAACWQAFSRKTRGAIRRGSPQLMALRAQALTNLDEWGGWFSPSRLSNLGNMVDPQPPSAGAFPT